MSHLFMHFFHECILEKKSIVGFDLMSIQISICGHVEPECRGNFEKITGGVEERSEDIERNVRIEKTDNQSKRLASAGNLLNTGCFAIP